jgi:hypothetical protein
VDYKINFIANADGLIYAGTYNSVSATVPANTQTESETDTGFKAVIMHHSYIITAAAGEKLTLQVQPLVGHTAVTIGAYFIVTKIN